ncbi:MutS family DNA mismatch repair protein [Propionispira raffinosivorans]|uniref:MutS family DNA mismatch repair protein n=1 Tax=Propionispira raffinosivorans TaxID=86959 RepID=UPI000369B183|nr:MutS family DNA mismatch repair protein [Propionispira raffinosivorans]
MKIDYFKNSLAKAHLDEKVCLDRINRITFLRFAAFCSMIIIWAFGYDQQNRLCYFLAMLCLGYFVYLIKSQQKLKNTQRLLKSRQTVLKQYLDRFSKNWHAFTENGKEYLTEYTTQAKDLDLLGSASLYQYICAAYTAYGKQKLSHALLDAPQTPTSIKRRQQSVSDLARKQDLSIDLQVLLNLLPAKQSTLADSEKFLNQIEATEAYAGPVLKFFISVLPILTVLSLVCGELGIFSWQIGLIFLFVQFSLSGFFYGKNSSFLAPLSSFDQQLKMYEQIFHTIEKAAFTSPLQELQTKLTKDGGACKKIRKLYRISECAKMRGNLFFYFLANTLLLWDFHCALHFTKWKQHTAQDVRVWLDTLGEFELTLSLAVLCHIKENYVFPTITDSASPIVQAVDLSHVLLEESSAIANSLEINATTCIITGSNMSGKTTFLRSIGISSVLAYAGAPVCAKSFTVSPMNIFTSMRIEDDISKGISTFYAELLRIKGMVEFSKSHQPMLILIDEIFKGTNSADRIIGAAETIRKLTNPWSITFVSTHDFELCRLAESEHIPITNYHFEEYYTDNEIHFDYKLKPGQCQTTNAKYLLKMAGIL